MPSNCCPWVGALWLVGLLCLTLSSINIIPFAIVLFCSSNESSFFKNSLSDEVCPGSPEYFSAKFFAEISNNCSNLDKLLERSSNLTDKFVRTFCKLTKLLSKTVF